MGDAGEGLIDQDSRIQERMEELERERATRRGKDVRDPEQVRALESLRLARTELEAAVSGVLGFSARPEERQLPRMDLFEPSPQQESKEND